MEAAAKQVPTAGKQNSVMGRQHQTGPSLSSQSLRGREPGSPVEGHSQKVLAPGHIGIVCHIMNILDPISLKKITLKI